MGYIRLGNLSLAEMQKLAGVEFPQEFLDYMSDKRQEDVSTPIAKNSWHCFHLPFELVVDSGLLDAVKKHLVPLGSKFQTQMKVSISTVN